MNNTGADMITVLHTLFTCRTTKHKAISLFLLSFFSFILASAVDFICFLAKGQTSLGTWYNQYWIGFFFVCGFLLSSFFVFRHEIKTKPENLFLAIILSITCSSSLFLSVNNYSWDTGQHYLWVVQWSGLGSAVELSVSDFDKYASAPSYNLLSLQELKDCADKLDAEDKISSGIFTQGARSHLYTRISSLPATLVFMLCTAFSVPFSIKYVLTRLVFALIYSFVTFFGMKQLRSGKMLFAVIALLPTAIFLATDYGYDYWVNAFMLFAVACLVRELQTPDIPITKKRMIILLGSFFIAFGPKAIYFPLVLLCLLLPRNKFSSPRVSVLFRGAAFFICFLIAASFLVPFFFISGPGIGDIRGGENVNSAEQVLFIFSNPFEYARILINFMFTYYVYETSDYINLYAYLGHSSSYLVVLVGGLMLFTAITDKSEVDRTVCTWKSRVLSLVLNVITVALIATALYVSFTAVGSETIAGCQPRYQIPLLFCTLVFLGSHRFAWPREFDNRKTVYNLAILGLMSFVYMIGLWQVYIGLLH